MSGITGLYRYDSGDVSERAVREMTAAIDHRGPDGSDVWCGRTVGLGHQSFETTPEATHARLPTERDGLVITADCRIDNRDTLLTRLDLDGPPETIPDSELILEAYREWGLSCPEELLGAFAFAIWDAREQRLVCARDHMGVKPFYYHTGSGLFAFGSEIKALHEVAAVSETLDETRIGDMLAGILEKERTFYEDIARLPPGHVGVVDEGGLTVTKYWDLDPTVTLDLGSYDAYVDRFGELFSDAVRCRLRANGRVGSTLSGGLDSSSITCLARDILRERTDSRELSTFSLVFDTVTESDEREYIEAVIDQGNLDPHFVAGDETSPLEDIEASMHYKDAPVIANNHFLHRELFREADHQDVQVVLDGTGGDQTLSKGQGFLAELLRRGHVSRLLRELPAKARVEDDSIPNLVWNDIVTWLAPEPARYLWRSVIERGESDRELNPVLDDSFVKRTGVADRYQEYRASETSRTQRAHHYQELTAATGALNMEVADAIGARFSIEPRFPFKDKRLVEFCLSMPDRYKVRHGWSRAIMRDALSGVLPESIRSRSTKGDLGPNFFHTLRSHDCKRIDRILETDDLHIAEYADIDAVRAAHTRLQVGDTTGIMQELWWPISLELWLEYCKDHVE